jgi:cell division protein FtsB
LAPTPWKHGGREAIDFAAQLGDNPANSSAAPAALQGGLMSLTPTAPSEPTVVETTALPRWVTILFAVAFALTGYLLYANYEQREALRKSQEDANKKTQAMIAEMDKTNARIADLKGQLDVTSQKLGLTQDELARARGLAQSLKAEQQKSDAQLREQIGAVEADTTTKIGQVTTQLSGTQTDLNATKADLAATKTQMQSMKGDLGVQSGLIARNHDEVEELKRLGERDIFEFSLNKSKKAPDHVGPIQVQLKKTDPKKYKYTINVLADDKVIEKKDRTVGEPIQFYVHGVRAPYEIVVFDVGKDQVKGYLSTPKAAAAAPPAGPTGQ